jgi:hypothetical protein
MPHSSTGGGWLRRPIRDAASQQGASSHCLAVDVADDLGAFAVVEVVVHQGGVEDMLAE